MRSLQDIALGLDPIAIAEELSGKSHWSEFNDEENAALLDTALHINHVKKMMLMAAGDTHCGITWVDFLNLMESVGFKCALRYDFKARKDCGGGIEEAIVYYREDGIIIWATSFGSKSKVNSAKMNGQVKAAIPNTWEELPDLGGSHGPFDHDGEYRKVSVNHDIREGFLSKLSKWDNNHWKPIPIWEYRQFLWFVDYSDEDENVANDRYRELTRKKILQCCDEAQKIMQVTLEWYS